MKNDSTALNKKIRALKKAESHLYMQEKQQIQALHEARANLKKTRTQKEKLEQIRLHLEQELFELEGKIKKIQKKSKSNRPRAKKKLVDPSTLTKEQLLRLLAGKDPN